MLNTKTVTMNTGVEVKAGQLIRVGVEQKPYTVVEVKDRLDDGDGYTTFVVKAIPVNEEPTRKELSGI